MKRALSLLFLTAAGFAIGWSAVRLWPAAESGGRAQARLPSSNVSSSHPFNAAAVPLTPLARRSQARQRAAALTPEEARSLVQGLTHPVPNGESEWWQEVLTRWAEGEPQAAADWLREFARAGGVPMEWIAALGPLARHDLRAALIAGSHIFDFYHLGPLITLAAEGDPRGTLAFCDSSPRYGYFAGPAFGKWLQREPDAALTWLRTSPLLQVQSFLNAAIADLSAIAPDRLPELLASLPSGNGELQMALSALAVGEVERDPAGPLQKFSSLKKDERARMLEPLANYLAHSAAPEDVAGFLAGLTKEERHGALEKLRESLTDASADRLLTFLKNPRLSADELGLEMLMDKNFHLGPEQAARYISAVRQNSDYGSSGVTDFWQRNLASHPAETIATMQGLLQSGAISRQMLLALSAGMSVDGPSAPLRKMLEALPEEHRAAPQALLALRDGLINPAADLTALSELHDVAARRAVLLQVYQNMQSQEQQRQGLALLLRLPPAQQAEALNFFPVQPDSARVLAPVVRGLLESAAAPSGDLIQAVGRVAVRLPHENGTAMQWLDSLPAGQPRDSARADAFYTWAVNDASAASAWLDAQPRGTPQRDRMVTTLVSQIVVADPERAWHWAATASDPEVRRTLQETVLPRWLATDPVAARAAAPLTNQPASP